MKNIIKIFLIITLAGGLYYVWYVEFNYRFGVITENKVYKSGEIPPEKIAGYIFKNNIKTVIDLRHPGINNVLNPGTQKGIDLQREVIDKLHGVRLVNIQSDQVPTKENLRKFFEVMDDSASYPVLIHCYHGVGRAMIYSAIYRIEYEGTSTEEARRKTRLIVASSSFAEGKDKGNFLINYKSRQELENNALIAMAE
ncbi:MAG: dual specificity protein phosphatase family protein [Xanthomonadales bacterium]|nr:dual specificity protein phosphatase family protein [Xanthomonadales bacterium]